MRVARLTAPGTFHHIIWRFVDRDWYLTDDVERAKYLRLLGRALASSDWLLVAYALMSSHIHLGAIGGSAPLESWAKSVNSPFARWMNERHHRLGPLFADRPKTGLVQSSAEATVIAYIHNNPVSAGVVTRASATTWTSHRFYVDHTPPSWLHTQLASERTGITLGPAFDAWVDKTPGESGVVEVGAVRNAARKRGSVEVATPLASTVVPIVKRQFAYVAIPVELCVDCAARCVGVPLQMLRSSRRSPMIRAGRVAAAHCAARLGIRGSEIAAALGISESAVSKILRTTLPADAQALLEQVLLRLELETAHLRRVG